MRVKLLMQNSQKGQGLLFLIIGILVAASFLLVNGLPSTRLEQFGTSSAPPATSMQETTDRSHENNLQLKTVAPVIASVTPTTTPPPDYCGEDTGLPVGINCNCPFIEETCQNHQCTNAKVISVRYGVQTCGSLVGSVGDCNGLPDGRFCFAKPVIYLYPTKDTLVNVKLDIPGTVTVSIPEYPTQTGWQNVLAHPDGSVVYQGKQYRELFYETSVTKKTIPTTGSVVKRENIKQELTRLTTKLGLLPSEQQEFLEYWLPKLDGLRSPYIFISVLTQQQKDAVDHVDISPPPDTFIQMLFYFKGVSNLSRDTGGTFDSLQPPVRTGFTAVEWGGTIDNN